MRKVFSIVVLVAGLFGTTFATASVEDYITQLETYITSQGPEARMPFLQTLASYKDNIQYSYIARKHLHDIYEQLMVRFDGCGSPSEYAQYNRFEDFKANIEEQGLALTAETGFRDVHNHQVINEMCYSANGALIVFNVPYMKTDKKRIDTDYPHLEGYGETRDYQNPINLFRYDIAAQELYKAGLDADHFQVWGPPHDNYDGRNLKPIVFHTWSDYRGRYQDTSIVHVIRGFGARANDIISLDSGYGDAGCRSRNHYAYNFVTDTVSVVKKCGGCAQYNEAGNYIGDNEGCHDVSADSADVYPDNLGEAFWERLGTDTHDNGMTIQERTEKNNPEIAKERLLQVTTKPTAVSTVRIKNVFSNHPDTIIDERVFVSKNDSFHFTVELENTVGEDIYVNGSNYPMFAYFGDDYRDVHAMDDCRRVNAVGHKWKDATVIFEGFNTIMKDACIDDAMVLVLLCKECEGEPAPYFLPEYFREKYSLIDEWRFTNFTKQ